jgi:hypothetical protein
MHRLISPDIPYITLCACMCWAQVVIKLMDTEPGQLRQDVIAAVNNAMNQGWVCGWAKSKGQTFLQGSLLGKQLSDLKLQADLVPACSTSTCFMCAGLQTPMTCRHAGMAVARACVRKGCTLVLLDLVTLPSSSERSHDAWETDLPAQVCDKCLRCCLVITEHNRNLVGIMGVLKCLHTHHLCCQCLQALLESLLAPGTPIPDGAVAHLSLGSRQYQASWQQQEGRWVVAEAASDRTAAASFDRALQFVHRPVARLQPQSSSAEVHSNVHRVSLLLEISNQSWSSIAFVGSDQSSSAPPEQPGGTDGSPVSVQCVARGCWGTCLPVAVAGVEGTEDGANAGPLALTVSVGQGVVNLRVCVTAGTEFTQVCREHHAGFGHGCSAADSHLSGLPCSLTWT